MIKKVKDRNKLKIKKLLYTVGGGVGGLGGWVRQELLVNSIG